MSETNLIRLYQVTYVEWEKAPSFDHEKIPTLGEMIQDFLAN